MSVTGVEYIATEGNYAILKCGGRFFAFIAPYSALLELDGEKCFDISGGGAFPSSALIERLEAAGAGRFSAGPGAAAPQTNGEALEKYFACSPPAVSALNLDLTPACNLDCVYCYAKGGDYGTESETMRFAAVRAALEEAARARTIDRSRAFRFEFFGGEPLLNTDTIAAVLEYERGGDIFTEGGVINRISTNLTVFDDKVLRLLDEGDFIVSVSIDGGRATQDAQRPYKTGGGSYDDIIRGVAAIKLAAPRLITVARMTVCSNPEGFLNDLRELVGLNLFDYCSVYCAATGGKGSGSLAVGPAFKDAYRAMAADYGNLLSAGGNIFKGCLELNRYIRYLVDGSFAANHCRAGRGYFTLAPDGAVYPCHRLIGKSEHRIEGGLKNIAAATPPEWSESVDRRANCRNCHLRYLCGGGCKQESLITGGSLLASNPAICDFARLIFESAVISLAATGPGFLKEHLPSSGELDGLFVLCGRDTVSGAGRAADKALAEFFKGFTVSRLLPLFILAAALAVFTLLPLSTAGLAGKASACPGTNEPWHEITVKEPGAAYLDAGYFTSYGEADGLTAKNLTCLAYSKKRKLLFIGTKDGGVITFDGKDFLPLATEPPLPSPNIISLCYSPSDDRLLAGTNAGLASIRAPAHGGSSKASIIDAAGAGVPSDTINCLACGSDGTVYAGTDHGIFTVFSDTVTRVVRSTSSGVEIGRVRSIFAGADGQIHIATDLSVLKTRDCHKFEPDDPASANRAGGATRIARTVVPAPPGAQTAETALDAGMALSSAAGLTVAGAFGGSVHIGANEGLPSNWVSCFACDAFDGGAGMALISFDTKLAGEKSGSDGPKFDAQSLMQKLSRFASADTVITREGDSVVIKSREMQRLLAIPEFCALNDEYRFFAPREAAPAPKIAALESLKSGLWIGTNDSGIAVFNGSEFVVFNKDNSPMTSDRITDILCCDEFVYVATAGGGLVRYGQYDAPAPGAEVEKILSARVEFIKAAGGDIYMGGKTGLYHYNLIDSTCEIMPERPELKNLRAFCAGGEGDFYAASGDAGVVRLSGKYKVRGTGKYRFSSVSACSKKDGAPSSSCSCVAYIENKGVMAGFSEISCKASEKCVIISPGGALSPFAPAGGDRLSEYDLTQPSLASPKAFLDIGEAVITGLGEGGSKALVFYSGSQWRYMTTPISCVFARVDSISRGRGGEVYIAGDAGAAVFDGARWKRIEHNGGIAIGDSVCAMKDTMSDGVWILTRTAPGAGRPLCALTFGSNRASYSKALEGDGISFAQLDPYVFVATSRGVYKIKKSAGM